MTKFKVMRGELSGCSKNVKEMLLLLLSYFNEKDDAMFCYVEDTCLAGKVEMDQAHLTPTIDVCGKSIFLFPFLVCLYVSLVFLYCNVLS